jgi:pyruvate ferredoxin oxidoreductase gamma subunit
MVRWAIGHMAVNPPLQDNSRVFQSRIHGRGGQGVVTAAELLSVAAFYDGKFAQAFPSFGSERTGAPVVAYTRFDDKPIRLREPVLVPQALIIQDPTLLHQVDVFSGVNDDAYILINTKKSWEELGIESLEHSPFEYRRLTVPASDFAMKYVGRPLPNAALLGGYAAATKQVALESVVRAIEERFPAKIAEGNIQAAREAYAYVRAQKVEAMAHA